METSFLQNIKKRAGRLIEPALLKSGRVLEVRYWKSATMIEIDLHLPEADMQQWAEVPAVKFRVSELTFRDYTPTGWDAETRTCTLLIDAAHPGPGSYWARELQKNDMVNYLKIEMTRHTPDPTALIVGLGDESSMGHLLGLQQLVHPVTRFIGAIAIGNKGQRDEFSQYFKSPLEPLARKDDYGVESLVSWVKLQGFCSAHTYFYLAGNNTLVSQLRRSLKELGYPPDQIMVKGFWS